MREYSSVGRQVAAIAIASLVALSMVAGVGIAVADNTYKVDKDRDNGTEENGPEASVTFENQTTSGTSVTIAAASNESAPFVVAIWTLDDAGNPDALVTAYTVNDTSATDIDLALTEYNQETFNRDETLVAVVHPGGSGDQLHEIGRTRNDSLERPEILASDTAFIDSTVDDSPEVGDSENTETSEDTEETADTASSTGSARVTAEDVEQVMDAMGIDEEMMEEMGMTFQGIADLLNEMFEAMSSAR